MFAQKIKYWHLTTLALAFFLLTGCQSSANPEKQPLSFRATVLEIKDGSMLVEALEEEDIHRSSDQLHFSTKDLPDIGASLQDTLNIVYTGQIQESYPAGIQVLSWSIEEKAPDRGNLGNEPPTLAVRYGEESLVVISDSAQWSSLDPERREMKTLAICGLAPLDRRRQMPTLQQTEERALSLSFVFPADRLTVYAWPEVCLEDSGEHEVGRQTLSVTQEGSITLPESGDGWVVDVSALWEKEEGSTTSYGDAQYTFLLRSKKA